MSPSARALKQGKPHSRDMVLKSHRRKTKFSAKFFAKLSFKKAGGKEVEKMEEGELIARAKRGDPEAFEQLMLAHQNKVYSLCLRMVGNPEDAQDAAQEAFLNAWRALPSFKGDSSFSTWLYRLASNACIDHLRKRKRRSQVEDARSLEDEERPWEPADHQADPALQLERQEARRAVEEGLQSLSDPHRQVLVLRELQGLSYQEIGQALDLDPGTVKSRIARARLALKKILTAKGNFFAPEASTPIEEPGKGKKGR